MEPRATKLVTRRSFPMLCYLFALKFIRDIPVKVAVSQTKLPVFDKQWEQVFPNLALLYFINRELYALSLRDVGYLNQENYINPFFL